MARNLAIATFFGSAILMNSFLDKAGVLSAADEASTKLRARIMEEIGVTPRALKEVAVKAMEAAKMAANSVEAAAAERKVFEGFIEAQKTEAYTEVNNLFTAQMEDRHRAGFRLLLRALLENPSGVEPKQVNYTPRLDVIETDGNRVISFNKQTGRYQFYSKAHEHAARTW